MLKKIEALIFGGRWRRDEYAWRAWQEIEPLIPERLPMLGRKAGGWEELRMAGRVLRIHQRARRGNKALVDFGSVIGTQDTWWEHLRPPVGNWVIVHAHLWLPPGTHSGKQVLWIDKWESWAAGDTPKRARRHDRRMEKEAARQSAEQIEIGQPSGFSPLEAGSVKDGVFSSPEANDRPRSCGEAARPDQLMGKDRELRHGDG